MTHEPTLACSGNATFLDDTSQCTHKEYGNTLSFMGNGSRHPSAVHKYHQGWIERLQPGEGRFQHDHHAGAAGAAL